MGARIAILHPDFSVRGGAERKILLIAQNLRDRFAFDIVTHAVERQKSFYELADGLSFKIVPLGRRRGARVAGILRMAAGLKCYDLYHAHNSPAHFAAALGKFIFRKPVLWFCNEPALYRPVMEKTTHPLKLRLYRFVERRLVKRIDIVVANSRYTAAGIKALFDVEAVVVYSGIDTEKYRPGVERRENRIFFVSRIVEQKNLSVLVRLMREIRRRNPAISLLVAGEGSYLAALKREAESSAPGAILFLGNIGEEEKIRLYAGSRVVVFPAIDEPLGLIPLESMACGTPVVAFNSGGCRETIVHAETGYLADSEREFIDYTAALLNDAALAEKMGRAGRERVVGDFSLGQMLDATEALSRELLARGKSRRAFFREAIR